MIRTVIKSSVDLLIIMTRALDKKLRYNKLLMITPAKIDSKHVFQLIVPVVQITYLAFLF